MTVCEWQREILGNGIRINISECPWVIWNGAMKNFTIKWARITAPTRNESIVVIDQKILQKNYYRSFLICLRILTFSILCFRLLSNKRIHVPEYCWRSSSKVFWQPTKIYCFQAVSYKIFLPWLSPYFQYSNWFMR